MKKVKLDTIAKVLTYVRDFMVQAEPLDFNQSRYICNCLKNIQEDNIISKPLFQKTYAYFNENRPTPTLHPKFYAYKHYKKEEWKCAWWDVSATPHSAVEVIEEKKRFLTYLINQLNDN